MFDFPSLEHIIDVSGAIYVVNFIGVQYSIQVSSFIMKCSLWNHGEEGCTILSRCSLWSEVLFKTALC